MCNNHVKCAPHFHKLFHSIGCETPCERACETFARQTIYPVKTNVKIKSPVKYHVKWNDAPTRIQKEKSTTP